MTSAAVQWPAWGPPGGSATAVRYTSLDGLRGIAALVVLVFHVMVVSPVFDTTEAPPNTDTGSLAWWLMHTPLHLVWLGPEAVYVFFVLSGFVLALPVSQGRVTWISYYPKRLVRLYVPVWASLGLAVLLANVVPRTPDPGLSTWFNAQSEPVELAGVARDGLLLAGTSWLNSPLWSLRWEVLFSLLLPLYVLGGRWFAYRPQLKFLGLFLALGLLRLASVDSLSYLGMFALGVLLAYHRDDVQRVATRIGDRSHVWITLAALAVLLLTIRPTLLGLGPLDDRAEAVARVLTLSGACLLVVLALHWGPLRGWLSRPRAQWVGARSFSLYLVHEPIVVSIALLLPRPSIWVLLAVSLPVSLIAAWAFHLAVEVPSQRLAVLTARRCRGRPGSDPYRASAERAEGAPG